jgi:hypothetical protein
LVGTRTIEFPALTRAFKNPLPIDADETQATFALESDITLYNNCIDGEILAAMKYTATTPPIGGRVVDPIDSKTINIIEKIFNDAKEISESTHMGFGNFVICTPDIVEQISKSEFFKRMYEFNFLPDAKSFCYEVGSIIKDEKEIKVFKVTEFKESYSLVGFNGKEPGFSGITFVPYIPFVFSKMNKNDIGKAGSGYKNEFSSKEYIENIPKDELVIICKARYAIVANIMGAGLFYRYSTYVR